MNPGKARPGMKFHELPLLLFTALAIAGAGLGTAHLGLFFLGWVPLVPSRLVLALMGALLAVGLLFSVAHLGRPLRGFLALRRLGQSPLSNEVAVVSVALAACLSAAALPVGHLLALPLAVAALASSALTLLALGLVYRLSGQLTWKGAQWAQPFVLGIGFGLTALLGTLPGGTEARGELLILLILLVDGAMVWEGSRSIAVGVLGGVAAHPNILEHRGVLVSLRVLLGILLPAAALLSGWPELAGILLFVNLFLHRFLFYGLAARCNTEAEIQRTEAALRAVVEPRVSGFDSAPTYLRAHER